MKTIKYNQPFSTRVTVGATLGLTGAVLAAAAFGTHPNAQPVHAEHTVHAANFNPDTTKKIGRSAFTAIGLDRVDAAYGVVTIGDCNNPAADRTSLHYGHKLIPGATNVVGLRNTKNTKPLHVPSVLPPNPNVIEDGAEITITNEGDLEIVPLYGPSQTFESNLLETGSLLFSSGNGNWLAVGHVNTDQGPDITVQASCEPVDFNGHLVMP